MKRQKERHLELQRKARDEVDHARGQAEQAALERDIARAELAARKKLDETTADRLAHEVSERARRFEKIAAAALLIMGGLAIVQYLTGLLAPYFAWTCVLAVAGLFGLYDFITNRLERPKIGVPTLLGIYCRRSLNRKLKAAKLSDQSIDDFEFDGRSLRRKARATEEPHAS